MIDAAMDWNELLHLRDPAAFAAEVTRWLEANRSRIPLEKACRFGGFPNLESVRILGVESLVDNAEALELRASLIFVENRGAGCANVVVEHSHLVDLSLHFEKATGTSTIRVIEPERAEEF